MKKEEKEKLENHIKEKIEKLKKALTLLTKKDDIQGDGVIDQVDAKT